MNRNISTALLCTVCLAGFGCLSISPCRALGDWPTHQGDYRRSGLADSELSFPLEKRWKVRSPVPPATAWTGPAKWDAYSGNDGLQSLRNFDPAFYVTISDGVVYYGSSLDHAVHAINASDGTESWVSFTDAPVRLPPTIADGRAWFASDDGSAYCVDAKSGELIWKFSPRPEEKTILNNGRYISPFPIRTGVIVHEGTAYFAASLLPWRKSYLCAVNAETGKAEGDGRYVKEHESLTLQGSPLLAGDSLLIPQGRSPMSKFQLKDGAASGQVADAGGVHCLLTEDDRLISGPKTQKNKSNVLQLSEPSSGKLLLTLNGVYRASISDGILFFQQGKNLEALDYADYIGIQTEKAALTHKGKPLKEEDLEKLLATSQTITRESIANLPQREAACSNWKIEHPVAANLVMTPSHVITGSHNLVQVFDRETGEKKWSTKVDGTAYGLAFDNGLLVVSTDHGHIYAFGGDGP